MTGFNRFLLFAHNLIYWFFLIPFFTPMSFATGIYTVILFTRFLANTYINLRNHACAVLRVPIAHSVNTKLSSEKNTPKMH